MGTHTHTHTHSSPTTQAIFGPLRTRFNTYTSSLAALLRAWPGDPDSLSRPITDQFILTNQRTAYSDQSQTTHQPREPNKKRSRGTEKAVSIPTADDFLATRYYYECNSLYKQTTTINSITCWSAVLVIQR